MRSPPPSCPPSVPPAGAGLVTTAFPTTTALPPTEAVRSSSARFPTDPAGAAGEPVWTAVKLMVSPRETGALNWTEKECRFSTPHQSVSHPDIRAAVNCPMAMGASKPA
ncbi:hypothetical protein ACFFX0_21165 [Citricoccus parietis]|uniref:Secreted protein n=1 Tax=Citricoccus parietis TaxID=592307 RepID=A0ABV5G3R0_9MICC